MKDNYLQTQKDLNEANIFPRRYFCPSLNTIEYVKGNAMPVSESIAVACCVCLCMLGWKEKIWKDF